MTRFIHLTILLLTIAVAGYAAPKEKAPKPAVPQMQPVPANKTPVAVAPAISNPVSQPPSYVLVQTTCSFPEPTREIWRVEVDPSQTGTFPPASDLNFDTLSSPKLRQWVSSLPKGSLITCITGLGGPNRVNAPSPALRVLTAELDDFTKFCKDKGVKFGYGLELF